MDAVTFSFFDKMPGAIPLYEAIREWICLELGNVTVRVQKTQIAFANRHQFAFVSLPFRKRKGWPEVCVILTFGLGRRVEHPRIVEAVEPYPGRWTHHVIIQDMNEADDEVKEWLREAYWFADGKRRGGGKGSVC